jgi:hypothetical protein
MAEKYISLDDLSKAYERLAASLPHMGGSHSVKKETEDALVTLARKINRKAEWAD